MNDAIAYVSCAEHREIHVLALDAAGGLRTLGVVVAPGDAAPGTSMALAMSPDRTVLHAAVRTAPFPVSSFFLADPERPMLLGTAELPDQMAYIATDRSGRHLLGASYHGSKIASCRLQDGRVVAPATQVIGTPPRAHSILTAPDNRFAFVACLGGDAILRFGFDADTGMLSALPPVATAVGAGPRHLRFSPDGRFLYLVNELDGTVSGYAYDAESGRLSLVQTLSLLPDGIVAPVAAADIHLTPDGRFLYASERQTNRICGFRVDAGSGMLTPAGEFAAEPVPRGFAIDRAGRFLLCAGQTSGRAAAYAIDGESGALRRLGDHGVGGNPNWIEFG